MSMLNGIKEEDLLRIYMAKYYIFRGYVKKQNRKINSIQKCNYLLNQFYSSRKIFRDQFSQTLA